VYGSADDLALAGLVDHAIADLDLHWQYLQCGSLAI
jgi:hypothetical protein